MDDDKLMSELQNQASSIPFDKRVEIIKQVKEQQLHFHLKSLFQMIEKDSLVEVTHGANEFGKDLVIVNRGGVSSRVTAVIVKRGDISGKTSGDVDEINTKIRHELDSKDKKTVDEIVSQIDQAITNEAELKSILPTLAVTNIVVVLAGNISSNARKRIKNEYGLPVDFKDMNWLVKNFSLYYPQIFFETDAFNFVSKKIAQLESQNTMSVGQKQLKFSEYFIEPMLAPVLLNVQDFAKSEAQETRFRSKRVSFEQLKTELASSKKTIVVGEPAAGKTGLVSRLCLDYLKQSLECTMSMKSPSKIPVPVMLQAKEINPTLSAEETLNRYFHSAYNSLQLKANIVIVDAIDEAPQNLREAVIEYAERMAEDCKCPLLITSRKIDLIEQPRQGYSQFEVMPFNLDQAIEFLKKVLNLSNIESIIDDLQTLHYQLQMNPLSLRMLASLVVEHKEIPASITELYERYFDIALGRDDKEKGIEVIFEYKIRQSFLARIAYELFWKQDLLEVAYDDFLNYTVEYLKEYTSLTKVSDEEAEKFIDEIERAGLLITNGKVHFKHRTYLDYFIALYLTQYADEFPNLDEILVKLHFDLFWTDVPFFYTGIKRRIPASLLERILETQVHDNDLPKLVGKMRIGRLLQAGWESGNTAKEKGIKGAVQYIPQTRKAFLAFFDNLLEKSPKLLGDYMVLILAGFCFNSASLANAIKKILEDSSSSEFEDLLHRISLFWAIRRFYTSDERLGLIGKFYTEAKKLTANDPQQYLRLLWILDEIEKGKSALGRSVRKALEKSIKRYPELHAELVNPKKKTAIKRRKFKFSREYISEDIEKTT